MYFLICIYMYYIFVYTYYTYTRIHMYYIYVYTNIKVRQDLTEAAVASLVRRLRGASAGLEGGVSRSGGGNLEIAGHSRGAGTSVRALFARMAQVRSLSMLTYAHVCSRIFTYDACCAHGAGALALCMLASGGTRL
jgi:hypothetical protein